jgi:hypothetical protein
VPPPYSPTQEMERAIRRGSRVEETPWRVGRLRLGLEVEAAPGPRPAGGDTGGWDETPGERLKAGAVAHPAKVNELGDGVVSRFRHEDGLFWPAASLALVSAGIALR